MNYIQYFIVLQQPMVGMEMLESQLKFTRIVAINVPLSIHVKNLVL